MIVIDGVDGSGKGVQTRRLFTALTDDGQDVILTREPGGSTGAEQIRQLLVNGDPEKWDSMTELLLMVASRRAHLRDTIWPAIDRNQWVVCDRFADSSRAFQGVAGNIGIDVVNRLLQTVMGAFYPALTLILDIPETIALDRAQKRGEGEDRFERKGRAYHARVREAFLQIAAAGSDNYRIIDGNQDVDAVSNDITREVNRAFHIELPLRTMPVQS